MSDTMGRPSRGPRGRWSGARWHRPDHRATGRCDHRLATESSADGRPGATFRIARYARVMRPSRVALALPLVALALAACGTAAVPETSFDPASACTTDGRFAGAYPELEALLPAELDGKPPATVDSGRNCTPAALGSLAGAGVRGVRFAGATWPMGGTSGLTV